MKKIYYSIFKHPAKTVIEMKRRKGIIWIITLALIALWLIIGAVTRSDTFSFIMIPVLILVIVILVMAHKEEKSDFPEAIICPKCHNRMIDSVHESNYERISESYTTTEDVEIGHTSFKVKGENVNATIYGKQDVTRYIDKYKMHIKCKHCGETRETIVYDDDFHNLFSFKNDWSH